MSGLKMKFFTKTQLTMTIPALLYSTDIEKLIKTE